jgi:hypothetical protein
VGNDDRRNRERGLTRSLGLVADWNVPSLSSRNARLRRTTGAVGYWNLGYYRRYFTEGAVSFDGDRRLVARR